MNFSQSLPGAHSLSDVGTAKDGLPQRPPSVGKMVRPFSQASFTRLSIFSKYLVAPSCFHSKQAKERRQYFAPERPTEYMSDGLSGYSPLACSPKKFAGRADAGDATRPRMNALASRDTNKARSPGALEHLLRSRSKSIDRTFIFPASPLDYLTGDLQRACAYASL